jgi:acyl-[acyl-carrier-protein]-phospholipid O-acyltransferase / long-chain-fatty-acid--[acyl-carrier-protein] ligase
MSDDTPGFEPTRRQWVGFWSMIVQQTQNAFNDKMAQFILIPLGGAVGYSVESAAGLMIALPFVLFAPTPGGSVIVIRNETVIFGSAVLQLVVLLWICARCYEKFAAGPGWVFRTGSAVGVFQPGEIRHQQGARGIESSWIRGGNAADDRDARHPRRPDHRWLDLRSPLPRSRWKTGAAWQAALFPLLILTVLAAPALFLAWIIPRVPAQGLREIFRQTRCQPFRQPHRSLAGCPLRRASFGVAFFWGFAAFINLWSVKLAKLITGGGDGFGTLSSTYMAAASLGMAGGFRLRLLSAPPPHRTRLGARRRCGDDLVCHPHHFHPAARLVFLTPSACSPSPVPFSSRR